MKLEASSRIEHLPEKTTFRGRLTVALAATTGGFLLIFCLVLYAWCDRAFMRDLEGDLYPLQRAEFAANDSLESHLRREPSAHGDRQSIEVFGFITDLDEKIVISTCLGSLSPAVQAVQ